MFAGHCGPSFVGKRSDQSVPLWILFLAVQLLDVFWAIFVFLGIEKVRIVPGFTETNALDLYYMPYTHSLPGALAWAMAAGLLYRVLRGSSRGGLIVGLAVFSHWVLDLVVHVPDLPLWGNTAKVGFGLWHYPLLTLGLEAGLFFGGLLAYAAVTRTRAGGRAYSFLAAGVVVLGVQAAMAFGPPPGSDKAMAATALVAYFVIAGVVAWLERGREPDIATAAA